MVETSPQPSSHFSTWQLTDNYAFPITEGHILNVAEKVM